MMSPPAIYTSSAYPCGTVISCAWQHKPQMAGTKPIYPRRYANLIWDGCARLDEQLGALESKLRDADGQVQQLLGHSTALWLDEGAGPPEQDETSTGKDQTGNGAEQADDADGPIQRRAR